MKVARRDSSEFEGDHSRSMRRLSSSSLMSQQLESQERKYFRGAPPPKTATQAEMDKELKRLAEAAD